jgi:hypothetical protein
MAIPKQKTPPSRDTAPLAPAPTLDPAPPVPPLTDGDANAATQADWVSLLVWLGGFTFLAVLLLWDLARAVIHTVLHGPGTYY